MRGWGLILLKERGWFWWADEKIPEGKVAPENYVAGLLSISPEGRISIDLDGVLPSDRDAIFRGEDQELAPDLKIAGILRDKTRYLLAEDVQRSSGTTYNSRGISYDTFSALRCVISNRSVPAVLNIKSIHFPLEGYEEWLVSGPFFEGRFKGKPKFIYKRQSPRIYSGSSGTVKISRHLEMEGRGNLSMRGTDLREIAELSYRIRRFVDFEGAIRIYGLIQDIMILLTSSEYQAGWPDLTLTNGQRCTAYCYRTYAENPPPNYYDCIASFRDIDEQFGNIFFAWLQKRESLGPGIYLYLSTRRGVRSYNEQRFFSLISGLEALHRNLYPLKANQAYSDKIQRILACITKPEDRNWLNKRMRNFSEPSLSERLKETLDKIPSGVAKSSLDEFATKCAAIRNSLSHHGKIDNPKIATDALRSLAVKNEILSHLYHAKILIEIGLPHSIVERWLTKGTSAYKFRWFARREGLKPQVEDRVPV
ncbi:hypothetical protein SAMN05216304_103468 [Bosea sp. OK403]|uniref:HEPN domain-containing protein n=1 Tax=Bosea sp. OK403 TaxID=1855286 RepID=UPI0008EC9834|nr:HEPN domain-containing protein [Bosea sp. OK403]SFI77542.1 hypothetical protein SAMN05216304_103468 [Bosea sp. OK403]